MTDKSMQIKPYPLGAHCEGDSIRFSFVSKKASCGIVIYDKQSGEKLEEIPFSSGSRIGNVYCKYLRKYKPSEILYQFYEGNHIVTDPYGVLYTDARPYGEKLGTEGMKAGFITEDFDWSEDRVLHIPYENSVVYLLHVRGFTQHPSSEVSHKGTFRGIAEKIPYLQEIGVTCVELQPAYEFQEAEASFVKLNYWGYKSGYYYAPKASYAADNPVTEFKQLVKELHKNGIEIVMQFYFPKEISAMAIPDILHYWVMEYHVDGFHLVGDELPVDALAMDPVLADSKLWYHRFSTDVIYQQNEKISYCNLAFYRDDYLYDMRKFLIGEQDMVKSVMYHMRHIPEQTGCLHYMSNYYSMTLMDMVSYDRKHNVDNGEENRDGNDYNYSWNCGAEGNTSDRKIISLRIRQLKNAMCLLMFSQSTPLIYMGDEFGNSQNGNNNPYCQDNEITWLDWTDRDRNAEIHAFWKMLVKIRKEHPVLHQVKEPQVRDYIGCGYPNLSYHGKEAWCPDNGKYSRCIGIMYCGKYCKRNHAEDDCFFYIAMNMDWEEHELALPKLPEGLKWQVLLSTAETKTPIKARIEVPDRCIVVCISAGEN